MDRKILEIAVEEGRIEWQRHALEKMLERGISRKAVKEVLKSGEVIEDYTGDKPFPSSFFLGWDRERPIHVVAALDPETKFCFIITAYEPDLEHFEAGFKKRRRPNV